jgi:carbon starvation protein
MTAMPVMIGVLCVMAIAYRYYSAFLAARVAALDDSRATPAVLKNDGQNFHPTSKWVLFGHHFAAISGAGPLIGPVLAAQFGYLPGLLWIVIGVCLGGAVQDFLVLAMSTRRGGRSLAQVAFTDIGKPAGMAATAAILFIILIALGGLGKVVVKALGGEEVKYPAGSTIVLRPGSTLGTTYSERGGREHDEYTIPAGSRLEWDGGKRSMALKGAFQMHVLPLGDAPPLTVKDQAIVLPPGAVRLVPGSSWGTFTIAATIPIALLVGLYMYKIRPDKTVEASILGAALTLLATFLGGYVASHPVGAYFNMSALGVTWAMAIYGFVAAVLPVWVLLAPRDYLSSFLKIGTIAFLIVGVLVANPKFEAPAVSGLFLGGGPVVAGKIFPFLFITVMCGAISGFHALIASGTTPKMLTKESHARTIGYGAMMMEGIVAVVALTAAATLPPMEYFGMNTELGNVPRFHDKFLQIGSDVDHLPLYEQRTEEALRGRTGGAVTLAVGMAHIMDGVVKRFGDASEQTLTTLWKYWYHFAIMFEALFILTTIDAGTRVGRFLLQEVMGGIHKPLGRTNWWPGAVFSTAVIVAGWAWFLNSDSFQTIWAMFGIANQVLAVVALAVVSAWLANEGRARYVWVTALPMLVVCTTTGTAAAHMLTGQITTLRTLGAAGKLSFDTGFTPGLQAVLILAMIGCTAVVVFAAAIRVWRVSNGLPVKRGYETEVGALPVNVADHGRVAAPEILD